MSASHFKVQYRFIGLQTQATASVDLSQAPHLSAQGVQSQSQIRKDMLVLFLYY